MGILARLFGTRQKQEKPVPVAQRRPRRVIPRSGKLGLPPTGPAPVGVEDIDMFANWGEKIFVTSTNVQAARYDAAAEELTLWFLNGSAYVYSQVGKHEAIGFITAPSKGDWVWDNLRIRGTHDGHRKPFRPL
jgi:hypothetical protein